MSTQLSQLDDNLVPGQTYTFQLNATGLQWLPSANDVQIALTNNAPNFLGDLQVTSPFTTSLYNVQFTYSGDGSDVVADVGASLVAALSQGLSKTFVFSGAVADNAQSITVSPSNAAQKVADTVGDAVHKALDSATKSAANAAQNVLTPIEIAVAILVGLVVLVIFTSGKAGGVSASEGGFKIGGK